MNFSKLYFALVSNKECRKKNNEIYYEKHHILPKCMGGDDSKENICLLTAREHFIAHRLLIKMHPNIIGLKIALFRLTHKNSATVKEFTSRQYEIAKKEMQIAAKTRTNKLNSFYGKKHSEETKNKISQKKKGKGAGHNNPNYGKTMSQQQKDFISKLNKGRWLGKAHSQLAKEKCRVSKLGEKNPNSKVWQIENIITKNFVCLRGGIKNFLSKWDGSSYFKLLNGTDPNWRLIYTNINN